MYIPNQNSYHQKPYLLPPNQQPKTEQFFQSFTLWNRYVTAHGFAFSDFKKDLNPYQDTWGLADPSGEKCNGNYSFHNSQIKCFYVIVGKWL